MPKLKPDSSNQRSTLVMVAQTARVSPSTVSRILNGTAKVSEAKRAAVIAAIEQLGFRPDPAARSLAGGRTMSVGVLTQSIDSPFYSEALRGLEDELLCHNYVPIFASGHWQQREEEERLALLQERKVDGIIVLNGSLTDATLERIAKDLPVVVTGRQLRAPKLFGLELDNVSGMRLAAKHLLELGHRRIAFVSGPLDHYDAQQRLAGYKCELEDYGVAIDPELIKISNFQEDGGRQAMRELLEAGVEFSAVLLANDQMAYGARLVLQRYGLRVPEDISLVGFDNLFHSAYTLPPMTTVSLSAYDIGHAAAKATIALLSGANPRPALKGAELIVRETTRPYVVDRVKDAVGGSKEASALPLDPEQSDRNEVFVLLGSNIDPDTHIIKALQALAALGEFVQLGRLWRCAAVGSCAGQDEFGNLGLLLRVGLQLLELRRQFKRLELELGRVPSVSASPRCIDIDIIFFNGQLIDGSLNHHEFMQKILAEFAPSRAWLQPHVL